MRRRRCALHTKLRASVWRRPRSRGITRGSRRRRVTIPPCPDRPLGEPTREYLVELKAPEVHFFLHSSLRRIESQPWIPPSKREHAPSSNGDTDPPRSLARRRSGHGRSGCVPDRRRVRALLNGRRLSSLAWVGFACDRVVKRVSGGRHLQNAHVVEGRKLRIEIGVGPKPVQ